MTPHNASAPLAQDENFQKFRRKQARPRLARRGKSTRIFSFRAFSAIELAFLKDVVVAFDMAAAGHRDLFRLAATFHQHALAPALEAWKRADDLPPDWSPYKQVTAEADDADD